MILILVLFYPEVLVRDKQIWARELKVSNKTDEFKKNEIKSF